LKDVKKADKSGGVSFGDEFAGRRYSLQRISEGSFKIFFDQPEKSKKRKSDLMRLYSHYRDHMTANAGKVMADKFTYYLDKIQVGRDRVVDDIKKISRINNQIEKFKSAGKKKYPVVFISPNKRISFANEIAVEFLGREIYWVDSFKDLKHPDDNSKISIDDYKNLYSELLKQGKVSISGQNDQQARRKLKSKVLDEQRLDDPSLGLEFNFLTPYSSFISRNGIDVWSCSVANYDDNSGLFLGSYAFLNFSQVRGD
jgi:hypothetical protein